MRFAASCSPLAEELFGLTQPVNQGVSGLAVTLQQPMIVNDTDQDGNFDPTVDQAIGSQTRSIMVAPLSTAEREFGVVTAINSNQAEGFSAQNLDEFIEAAGRISQRLETLWKGRADV